MLLLFAAALQLREDAVDVFLDLLLVDLAGLLLLFVRLATSASGRRARPCTGTTGAATAVGLLASIGREALGLNAYLTTRARAGGRRIGATALLTTALLLAATLRLLLRRL